MREQYHQPPVQFQKDILEYFSTIPEEEGKEEEKIEDYELIPADSSDIRNIDSTLGLYEPIPNDIMNTR